jgi:hypothetical protein
MATTEAGALLTEQERELQMRLRAAILRQALAIWPALDIRAIDETWPAVETALMAVLRQGRAASAALSQVYYAAFRRAEGVLSGLPTVGASTAAWEQAAAVSLHVTGPVALKQLVASNAPQPAATAFVRMSGALGRHVLNGGRETIQTYLAADEAAIGYARATSPTCCSFCAMLASRGPVYKKESVDFRAHDHCVCTSEPVFKRGGDWPGRAKEFQEVWRSSTAGLSGRDARRAFRRAIENR